MGKRRWTEELRNRSELGFYIILETHRKCGPSNVIYHYFSHYHYFNHFESKDASPLPHAGGINTEDDQKFSPDRG